MTKINFYATQHHTLRSRVFLACRLVEKAREHNMKVHIYTDSDKTTRQMDEMLWIWKDTSFIPHISDINPGFFNHPQEAVIISSQSHFQSMSRCDYLINLSNQVPEFFPSYLKMAEIIDQTERILTAGRERYSFYKNRGYTLNYYQL